jgi:hypothetical protein
MVAYTVMVLALLMQKPSLARLLGYVDFRRVFL